MFWNNLVTLCAEHNITPSALTKELSIAKGVVTKWKNGSIPHQTTLIKIANYFNVTVEYLKGDESLNKKKPADADEFTELFSQLTDEQKKIVIAQIKGILSNQ